MAVMSLPSYLIGLMQGQENSQHGTRYRIRQFFDMSLGGRPPPSSCLCHVPAWYVADALQADD